MAQRSNQRQPVYSADALALRYIGGLALAALGVMMFLAVDLHLAGNVFDALRQVCFGLTGGLAVVLPALPVWAGALVIWSSQKKAPVKPFVWASLAFVCLCAFVVLVTKIGSEEFLGRLSRGSDGSWGGVIAQGYFQSAQLGQSGGALGVLLAFPFWRLLGTILGAVLLMLGMLACGMMAAGLTPGKIRDLAKGKAVLSWPGRRGNRAAQDQQQIAYQQAQERQRQMAMAQQQEAILRQQQAARQNSASWPRQMTGQTAGQASAPWPRQPAGQNAASWPQQQPAEQNAAPWPQSGSWTGTQPPVTQESVLDWQQQLTDQRAAKKSGKKSSIFRSGNGMNGEPVSPVSGDRPAEETGRSRIFGNQPEEGGARRSLIFGRKKEEEDGLSDLSFGQKRQAGMAYPAERDPRKVREYELRTAVAQRKEADQGPQAQPVSPETGRNARIRAEQQRVEEDLAAWERPAADTAARDRTPAEPRGKGASGGPGKNSWLDQVIAAEQQETPRAGAGEPAGRRTWQTEMPEPAPSGTAKEEKPKAAPVPVAQEMIKDPTWKPELKQVTPREETEEEEYWEPTPYVAPPITDLKRPDAAVLDTSAEDEDRSRRLEATLASFKVQARVVHVTHGPAISRFELELAPGTKVGKVSELEKDIAYGMQATSVRIEAPIPGKALVGVEVPNPQRATVTLREVLESPQMQNAKSILTVALGKDIAGVPVICDLAKMPHMLIAGATGSGKSVCINTIINSLLFRASPEEVKLILVDPKVVELQCYNGIPHLLLPVVNDPHKAAAALAWAVAEMMERYDKFAERGVRNLQGYNDILKPGEKPMSRIVIIIDELADLMMVCKKDVEEYICRLTQLARAAGIHLIVATQRPSVDVITGLIKANIPSRIAFKTASYVDSRTILDRNGSEQLLGWGDMLYLPTGSFAPTRVQGCFLSDEEVNRIADHVRQANPCAYDPDVLDKLEQLSQGQEEGPSMDVIGGMPESGNGDADLFAQAVEYAIADGQISTSTLQRRLKVGYARAGRLTDELEERGIVSAKDGSKPRKCLITREQWEAMQAGEAS